MTTLTAALTLNEANGSSGARERQGAYLAHVIAAGRHPHLTAALTSGSQVPPPHFDETLSRILTGLLGPDRPR